MYSQRVLLVVIAILGFPSILCAEEAPIAWVDYLPGRILVGLEPWCRGTPEGVERLLLDAVPGTVRSASPLLGDPGSMNALALELGLDRIYAVACEEASDHPSLASALSQAEEIAWVELDWLYEPLWFPNDPMLSDRQWGLYNWGQEVWGGYCTPDVDIDGPEAWNLSRGNAEQVIAVLDSGIDYHHEDLATKCWVNSGEVVDGADSDGNGYVDDWIGWDFYDGDNAPFDSTGHGTAVSSVAVAETDNGVGMAGVCPLCRVMAVRVGNTSFASAAIIQGLYYATNNRASVISMSFGASDSDCSRSAVDEVLEYAFRSGVALVAAAGNDEGNDGYMHPACRSEVIGVAGLNFRGGLSMSRHGKWVDVAAPGSFVIAAELGGGYDWSGGTSVAAPHVAGVVGLIRSECPDLGLGTIREILLETSEPFLMDTDEPIHGGRLNAHHALAMARELSIHARFEASAWTPDSDTLPSERATAPVGDSSVGPCSIGIYDLSGRLIRTIASAEVTSGGVADFTWDGLDKRGHRVGSGVYFYRVHSGRGTQSGKLMIVR